MDITNATTSRTFNRLPKKEVPNSTTEVAVSWAHSAENRWPMGYKGCRVETTYRRNVGRPPARWTDNLIKVAGRCWMQVASNRPIWKSSTASAIRRRGTCHLR
uniref:SFRICE_001603 n=1 Tax=Spodoptera frugiperda TaxID=7108 RepID=A0A2H1WV75_SPOFR